MGIGWKTACLIGIKEAEASKRISMNSGILQNNSQLISSRLLGTLLVANLLWAFNSQNCLAQETNVSTVIQAEGSSLGSVPDLRSNQLFSVTPLIPANALKSTPSTFEVYQYDSRPLGDRAPVLLIHGLEGEFHAFFRWKQLAQYLSEDPSFQHRYKIYLARFKTRTSLTEMTEGFKRALRDLPVSEHLTIVAISMSCQVLRNAMQDPSVDRSITRVITLGGFFRGSPLFCSDWVKQSIEKRHLSPLYRFDRYMGYKLYFAFHKNLLHDFVWDNVDGQMPSLKQGKSKTPELTANIAHEVKSVAVERQPGDEKFVVYAGYLHNLHTSPLTGSERVLFHNPLAFLRTTLPTHFGRERPVLRFLNQLIAETIPKSAEVSNFIYSLNDGISPISSGLLLSDDFVAHSTLSKKQDIIKLGTYTYARKARLFDNIDHLTFIEGRRRFRPVAQVTDVLVPSEEPRPIFSWILQDILDRSDTLQQGNHG